MSALSLKSRRRPAAARLSAAGLALGALAGLVAPVHAKDKPAAPSAGPPAPDAATDPCLSDPLCRAHFQRARTLSKDGDLAAALAAYQAAYRRKPARWLLLNIGRTLHKLGKPAEALTTYRQFLEGEGEAAPEARAKAREYIAEAEQELAGAQPGAPSGPQLAPSSAAPTPQAPPAPQGPQSTTTAPTPPGAPTPPVAGTEPAAPPAATEPQALAPPATATSPGALPASPGEPAVSPGGLASTSAQTSAAPAPPIPAATAPAPQPAPAPVALPAVSASAPQPLVPPGRRIGLGIGLGVTAALALAGIGTGAVALQGQDTLSSTPYGGTTPPPELQSIQDRTRLTAAITDGALIAAAVSLTVTLAVTFARRPAATPPAARVEKGAR